MVCILWIKTLRNVPTVIWLERKSPRTLSYCPMTWYWVSLRVHETESRIIEALNLLVRQPRNCMVHFGNLLTSTQNGENEKFVTPLNSFKFLENLYISKYRFKCLGVGTLQHFTNQKHRDVTAVVKLMDWLILKGYVVTFQWCWCCLFSPSAWTFTVVF